MLDSTSLQIDLSTSEKTFSRHRGSMTIARSGLARIQLTDGIWSWVRGARKKGTVVPGVLAMGTWATPRHRDFVLIRSQRPGVVIDLDETQEFSRILLTTQHALSLVQVFHQESA